MDGGFMTANKELQKYGINIPTVIRPNQAAAYGGGTPRVQQHELAQVTPKVYKKQKWFKTYEQMVEWKSQNGIGDAKMVKMQRPYHGYRYQLHYNDKSVTNKSRSLIN